MLFHADRNVKENMLSYMKKEAEDSIARKNENKAQHKNEDRMRIESIIQKEKQDQELRRMERLKNANEMMNGYNSLMNQKTERGLRKNKFDDIKINTYGVNYNHDISNKRLDIHHNTRKIEDYGEKNIFSGNSSENSQNPNSKNNILNQ